MLYEDCFHNFLGKAATWYYSLTQGSITSWNQFEEAFLEKFGEEKKPTVLVINLSRMKIHHKERVKYFNHRFTTLLSKILQALQPVQDILIGFYLMALPYQTIAYVVQQENTTLA